MTGSITPSSPRVIAAPTNTSGRYCESHPKPRRSIRKMMSACCLALLGGMVVLSSSGCSSCNSGGGVGGWLFTNLIESPVACYREKIWAKRAFNLRYPNCQHEYPADFREGFIEGYCNSCNGGDSTPPALPPETYWKARYSTEEGNSKVKAWFAGYPAGAQAAQHDGNGKYHQIQLSNEMQAAMVQLRQDGEDVVNITSIEPTTPGNGLPEDNLQASPDYQHAGPIYPGPGQGTYEGPNQVAPNQIAPNRIAPNQVTPNPLAPNRARPYQAAPNQPIPNQPRPYQVAPNQVAPNQVAPNQVAPNQVAPQQGRPGALPPIITPRQTQPVSTPGMPLGVPARWNQR